MGKVRIPTSIRTDLIICYLAIDDRYQRCIPSLRSSSRNIHATLNLAHTKINLLKRKPSLYLTSITNIKNTLKEQPCRITCNNYSFDESYRIDYQLE